MERQAPDYLSRAEREIEAALAGLFQGRERTLQRLFAEPT